MKKENKQENKKMSRKEQRRYDSACTVIDNSLKIDSRISVARVDLYYKKGKGSLEKINNDLDKLRLNSRSKPSIFKDQIGYIIKIEKGGSDNYHSHALFIFKENVDASIMNLDEAIGNMKFIGTKPYWYNGTAWVDATGATV